MHFRVASTALCVAALSVACPATAWAGEVAAADKLFNEALALADAGKWDVACPLFKASYDAEPSVGALLNVAECNERAGQLLVARAQFEEAGTRNASTSDAVRRDTVAKQVTDALTALDARIPTIVIRTKPVDAIVTLDGAELGDPQKPRQVAVAEHKLRVEADGFERQERKIVVTETQRLVLDFELAPIVTKAPPPSIRYVRAPVEGDVVPGIVVGSIGLAVAGTGGLLLGLAAGKAADISELCGDDPNPPDCYGTPTQATQASELSDSGRTLEIAGFSLLGAGGAALGTAVILLIVSGPGDDGQPAAQPAVSMVPLVGPKELGWGLVTRF